MLNYDPKKLDLDLQSEHIKANQFYWYKYTAGLHFFGILDEKYHPGSDSCRGDTLSDYPEIGDSRHLCCLDRRSAATEVKAAKMP